MFPSHYEVQLFSLLFIFSGFLHICSGDVGRAAHYPFPYLPTACYGNDVSQFPSSYYFASAGEVIWNNGAACGWLYWVRCLNAQTRRICKAGKPILVKIVDRAQTSVSRPSTNGADLVLSTSAFGAIANLSAAWVKIEYARA